MGKKSFNLSKIKQIWAKESEGIGDTVKKITTTLGIESCEACEERRKRWNDKVAYKKASSK